MQLAVEWQAAYDLSAVGLEAAVHVVEPQPREPSRDAVEDPREQPSRPRIAAPRLPAGDQVEALVEFREQTRDLCRIVLEVAVDRDDDIALGLRKPGSERRRLAEVAAQPDDPHVVRAGMQLHQGRERPVGGPVVDEDRLPVRADALKRAAQLVEQQGDAPLLVVDGDDDGDHGSEPTAAASVRIGLLGLRE